MLLLISGPFRSHYMKQPKGALFMEQKKNLAKHRSIQIASCFARLLMIQVKFRPFTNSWKEVPALRVPAQSAGSPAFLIVFSCNNCYLLPAL